jgi:hypothetical protein
MSSQILIADDNYRDLRSQNAGTVGQSEHVDKKRMFKRRKAAV